MAVYRCLFRGGIVRYLSIVMALTVTFFQIKSLADSSPLLEKQRSISQVVLATGPHYSPYIDANLPESGWSTAVVMAVFKQQDITVNIEVFPWSRVLESTKLKLHDGAFPFIYTDSREQDFYYSEAINYVPIKIVASSNVIASTLDELKKYTFCLPYGYSITKEFVTVMTPSNTTKAPTTRDCLNKVVNDWADIVLVNQYSTILHHERYKQLTLIPITLDKVPLYFIVSKSHPNAEALIMLFNQGLHAIKKNNVFANINKQFELVLEKYQL